MKAKVDALLSRCVEIDGCWLYQGNLDSSGYAYASVSGKAVKGHRMVYEYLIADIPSGLVVDHLCRNRNCLNPWHFDIVTNGVNVSRKISPNALKTHCLRGHEFSQENTYYELNGARKCRKCGALRARRRRVRSVHNPSPLRVETPQPQERLAVS